VETSWEEGSNFELRAPILNFSIQDALDSGFRERIAAVLKFWIDIDMKNIFRIKSGNHHFQTPYEYETNSAVPVGGWSEFGGPFTETSVERAKAVLTELLSHVTTHHYRKDDLVGAAIYATALRRLSPRYVMGEFSRHDVSLHAALNNYFGMNPPTYSYQAVDELKQILIDKLAQHGILDSEKGD
jgi:hypothetical protein